MSADNIFYWWLKNKQYPAKNTHLVLGQFCENTLRKRCKIRLKLSLCLAALTNQNLLASTL